MKSYLGIKQIAFLVSCALTALSPNGLGQPSSTPASTPPGVMLVEVHREEGFSSDQYFWTRLGDTNGSTLFYNEDHSHEATEDFRPVPAANDAVAFDDWSIVSHGSFNQWAYQSHPLFTWTMEEEAGQIAINYALYGSGPNGEEPLLENSRGALMPPQGWRVARFTPSATATMPYGFELQQVDSSQGVILTNFEGFSLYTYSDTNNIASACMDEACYENWIPVPASALSIGLGDFSIIDRIDGTRQWAFRDRGLFQFKGDLLPGDVNGHRTHGQFQLAVLKENFTPTGVEIFPQPGYGDIFTLDGKTLYFGSAFEKYWGGRSLRGSFEIAYFKGKRLGGGACVSEACLVKWHPFIAPASATSNGFWEVVTRLDGRRQWAYKGFALYTSIADQGAGQMNGHSIYDIAEVDGNEAATARTKLLAEVGNALGGAGVYWSVAKP